MVNFCANTQKNMLRNSGRFCSSRIQGSVLLRVQNILGGWLRLPMQLNKSCRTDSGFESGIDGCKSEAGLNYTIQPTSTIVFASLLCLLIEKKPGSKIVLKSNP
jgi:hypothetical protein